MTTVKIHVNDVAARKGSLKANIAVVGQFYTQIIDGYVAAVHKKRCADAVYGQLPKGSVFDERTAVNFTGGNIFQIAVNRQIAVHKAAKIRRLRNKIRRLVHV